MGQFSMKMMISAFLWGVLLMGLSSCTSATTMKWQIIHESRTLVIGDNEVLSYQATLLGRPNGMTLEQKTSGGDLPDINEDFVLKARKHQIRFSVTRLPNKQNPSFEDYYVSVDSVPGRTMSVEKRINRQFLVAHAKAIESGLLKYPQPKVYHFKPVKKVFFNLACILCNEKAYIVTADELPFHTLFQQ